MNILFILVLHQGTNLEILGEIQNLDADRISFKHGSNRKTNGQIFMIFVLLLGLG